MNSRLQQALQNLVPFVILGILVAFLIGLIFMFSYILVWGLVIGGILWIISFLKQFFLPSKAVKKQEGRIIDHNDPK